MTPQNVASSLVERVCIGQTPQLWMAHPPHVAVRGAPCGASYKIVAASNHNERNRFEGAFTPH
ncbi:hypothetical protein P7B02_03325 [Caulobacter segnis]|nr:hypothetical protein [Caulobacter segnis]